MSTNKRIIRVEKQTWQVPESVSDKEAVELITAWNNVQSVEQANQVYAKMSKLKFKLVGRV